MNERQKRYAENRDHERAQQAEYRKKNHEKLLAQRKLSVVRDKEKIRAQKKLVATRNKDKIREQKKAWRLANPEKTATYAKTFRETHKDEIKEKNHLYYLANSEQMKKSATDWGNANPERRKEIIESWHVNNPERSRYLGQQSRSRRRASIKGNDSKGVSFDEWQEILVRFNHSCAYCNEKNINLVREHVRPISKGGSDDPDNVVPACKSCNSRKCAKLLINWLFTRELGVSP